MLAVRARGFHAYVLHDDYEVARYHSAAVDEPARPRRLAEGDEATLEADGAQADVIFSRTDAQWL